MKKIVLLVFVVCLLMVTVGVYFVKFVAGNPVPVPPLKMPEEYIDVTISFVDGTLWAKVDGTYPLYKFDVGNENPIAWLYVADSQNVLYPVPPNTTNISVKMDETELNWTSPTETHPQVIYSTAIGYWPYIAWGISSIPDHFVIKTHYEHPIPTKNGNYTFLYPLILWSYLNPWCNKSTAYFSIHMETKYENLNLYTVSNGTWNPINYTITKENTAEIITFQIVSEWSKPLAGDVVIILTDPEPADGDGIGDTPFLTTWIVVAIAIIAIGGVAYFATHKKSEKAEKLHEGVM